MEKSKCCCQTLLSEDIVLRLGWGEGAITKYLGNRESEEKERWTECQPGCEEKKTLAQILSNKQTACILWRFIVYNFSSTARLNEGT